MDARNRRLRLWRSPQPSAGASGSNTILRLDLRVPWPHDGTARGPTGWRRLADPRHFVLAPSWARSSVASAPLRLLTALYSAWLGVTNPTIVALSFLLVVLIVAAASTRRVAVGDIAHGFSRLQFLFSAAGRHLGPSQTRRTGWRCLRCWRSASSRVTCRLRYGIAHRKPRLGAMNWRGCSI